MDWIEAVTRPGEGAEMRRRVLAVVVNRHPRRRKMLGLERGLCTDDADAVHCAWHTLPNDLQIELNRNYRGMWAGCSHFGIALGGAVAPAPSWWPPGWVKIYLPRNTRNV